MKRVGLRVVLCVSAALAMAPLDEARADEPAPVPPEAEASCTAAFETADLRLRPTETRLLEARAALRTCAMTACKTWMVADCTKRLAEVEGRIPSVAFSAEDERGRPVYDVRVLEGDRELASGMSGRAVEMDPGPHEVAAERAGKRITMSIIVVEGKKAQQVVFTFPSPKATATKPSDAPDGSSAPIGSPRIAHPWAPPLALALLGGGVVAAGVGVGFGADAIAKKKDARCDAQNFCDGDPLDSARSSARAATVLFVLSGALAVGGLVTYFAFGRTRVQATASLNQVHLTGAW